MRNLSFEGTILSCFYVWPSSRLVSLHLCGLPNTCLPPQNIFRVLFFSPIWVMKEREWDEEEMLHRKQGLRWRTRTLICISFLGPSHQHADTFLFASLSLTSLLYTPFFSIKLLMRFVRRNTFSQCPGSAPRPERRSTTSVQLMRLVSPTSDITHQVNLLQEMVK